MRGSNEKSKNWVKGVMWLTFRILGPLYFSGVVEARNFKLQTDHKGF